MTIQYVLWDNDGVLVDTEGGYFVATRRALREIGVELDRAHYIQARASGESVWRLAAEAGVDPRTIAQQRHKREAYYQQFIREAALEIPGAEAVIRLLASQYRMAIVTTSKRDNFDLIHQERRIVQHMEFVLTQEDFANEKPAPDGYLAALARFGAEPSGTVVVEDSAQGLAAARAAGLPCVIVRNAFFGNDHDFSGAAAVLSSIQEVPAVLVSLGQAKRL